MKTGLPLEDKDRGPVITSVRGEETTAAEAAVRETVAGDHDRDIREVGTAPAQES